MISKFSSWNVSRELYKDRNIWKRMKYLVIATTSLIASCNAFTFPQGRKNVPYLARLPNGKQPDFGLRMGIFDQLDNMMASSDDQNRENDNTAYLQGLQKRVDAINALESEIEDLGDDELTAKTDEFRKRLSNGENINGKILEEAFAVVREAAWRVLELRHYDVQIMGGLILHDGRLAEMATGEGKTLVSTLPAYVNALIDGKSSYVITVNDYLARRDMEKMGQVHRFLGFSVGLVQASMSEKERQDAYNCDIVYVTNSELGFDYLRDHLAISPEGTVLPGGAGEFSGFCIVDEADSVLIDEARTPLIISKQVPAPANKYAVACELAEGLREDVHYTVDLKNKNVILTEDGYRESEALLGITSLFDLGKDGQAWAPFLNNAIKAKELFTRDVEYCVLTDKSGEKIGVGIIDSFTGRVLDGRRWSDGLHQSIESREGIVVSDQSQVIAKVTYQSLFRQFARLSGMTGTALADAKELEITYGLQVTPVPTALPIARRDYPDVAFKTRDAANKAMIKEVVKVGGGNPEGRPCLIGTTSVAQSEQIVKALEGEGINAELLNASPENAPRESEIIAQAGRAGIVTVATNMAGRGTDILLGGCPKTMSRIKTRSILIEQGVISAEEAGTLPPSPPESYFPCLLDKDIIYTLESAASLIKKEVGTGMTAIELDELLTVSNDATEAENELEHIIKLREATEAVLEVYRDVLDEEKEIVKGLGGLYVMGTNRHESSRIDQQLRGRAGRQGDPGSSRFFLSFEDDMFVIFGGDKLDKILQMFRVSDDIPVEAPQVTDALNSVQKTVEEKYQEIRGEIFRFDSTLNDQRKEIYATRRDILFRDPSDMIEKMMEYNKRTVYDIVDAQSSDNGNEVNEVKVLEKLGQFFPGALFGDFKNKNAETVKALATAAVQKTFGTKMQDMELAAKAADRPPFALARTASYLTLVSMDNAWSEHLENMEGLKETVLLRSYEGKDPIQEYRQEGFSLYKGLEDKMRSNTVFSLWQSLAQQAAVA